MYTCAVDITRNVMIVLLSPAALKLQSIFRFAVPILNPPFAITNVSMEVKAMK